MTAADLITALKAAAAVPPKSVHVAGLGLVYVKPPTVGEVDAARADLPTDAEAGDGLGIARAACTVICDEHGARVLDPKNQEHVDALRALPWRTLQQVLDAVRDDAAEGN